MKKNNVIVFALLVLLSVFLLWLWFYLGFNRVDNPFDLVLSIIWWIVVAVGIVVIVRLEQVRRRRIRTVYVGDISAFNSEKGLLTLDIVSPVQDNVAALLDGLKYDFTRKDFPEPEDFQPRYFIRTDKFEAEKKDNDANSSTAADASAAAQPVASTVDATQNVADAPQVHPTTWKGEVVVVGNNDDPRAFDTPEELAAILASLAKAA